jgi:hypothetical protein
MQHKTFILIFFITFTPFLHGSKKNFLPHKASDDIFSNLDRLAKTINVDANRNYLENISSLPNLPRRSVTAAIKELKKSNKKRKKIQKKCCGKEYFTSSSFRFHQESKHQKTPYQCLDCNKKYGASSSLLLHLRTKHPETRSKTQLQCKHCHISQKIHWPAILAHHIKDRHRTTLK